MQALRDEIERLKREQELRRSDPKTVVVEQDTLVAVDKHLQLLMRSIIEPNVMVMEKLANKWKKNTIGVTAMKTKRDEVKRLSALRSTVCSNGTKHSSSRM